MQLANVMNAFIQTEILTTACRLGLFDYLAEAGSASGPDIALRFGLDTQHVRVLMLGCKQAGLVCETEFNRFANTNVSGRYLTTASPESVLNFVAFVRDVQQKTCRSLFSSLKEKQPVGLRELGAQPGQSLYDLNSRCHDDETNFHAAMSEYSRAVAPPPLPELSLHRRLLDIGGGNGFVAHRICLAHPHLWCTVIDLPSVSEHVAEMVNRGEISDRVNAVGADVFNDPWPHGADSILLSHFVEIFDPLTIQSLYRCVFDYLPPGGRVMIWTLTAPLRGEISLQAVKSSVYFLTTTGGGGMTYSTEEHEGWLKSAGLRVERIETCNSMSHNLIVATKSTVTERRSA
ncbi:MAG TPA: methyltransferase [Pyrinomonadaceae bacterium]|nr:methyltransferase [Pyrinomonadaceae bacterium]